MPSNSFSSRASSLSYNMKSSAAFVAFGIALAGATPVPGTGTAASARILPRSEDPLFNEDLYCHSGNFSTVEQAMEHWTLVEGSHFLDAYIKIRNDGSPANWLKNFERYIFKDIDRTSADGCSVLEGDCRPGEIEWSCRQYFELGSWYKPAFWIFTAVKGFHNIMDVYYNKLRDETIFNSLQIDKMIEDLDGSPETGDDMLNWVAAAFTMLGSGFGPVRGLGEPYGLIGTLLPLATKEEKEPINGDIKAGLADAFRATTKHLEKTLRMVMGTAESEEDYENLPAPTDDSYESKIAKFFNTGAWLVEIDSSGVTTQLEEAVANLGRKVASEALAGGGWALVLNDHITNTDDCTGGAVGRQWIEWDNGKSYCASMHWKDEQTARHVEAKPEFYEEKMKHYGIDNLDLYYRSVMDCAFHGDQGHSLVLNGPEIFKVPRCFFRLPVLAFQEREQKMYCGRGAVCTQYLDEVSPVVTGAAGAIAGLLDSLITITKRS
ncbi:hypothetical protein HJFPF1_02037 [Paramyrothecium foliicola]|nr:hypothetical protein HJFPF1_02037 [Paramyrothecium foliicola]